MRLLRLLCLAVWAWGGCLPAPAAQEQAPYRLSLRLPERPVYRGELVPFVLRLAYDPAFVANRAVPLFQQPLDLPVHIEADFLQQVEETMGWQLRWRESPSGMRVATGDRARRWTTVGSASMAGRNYEQIELVGELLPQQPGQLSFTGLRLRHAFATSFQQHFLRGREPLDRQEAWVAAEPVSLLVAELPAAGRPPDAAEWVGEFALAASLPVAAAEQGGSLTLQLRITGDGDLATPMPVPWPQLPGFAVQGRREEYQDGERRWLLDLLCLRQGEQTIAPVALSFFSPQLGGWRTVHSAALPVVVAAPAGPLPARVRDLIAADLAAEQAARALTWQQHLVLASGVFGLAVLAFWLQRHYRRRLQLRALVAACTAALPAGAQAAHHALEQCLVLLAGLPLATGSGEAALQRLRQRRDLANMAAVERLWQQLAAARYGGPLPSPAELAAVLGSLLRR